MPALLTNFCPVVCFFPLMQGLADLQEMFKELAGSADQLLSRWGVNFFSLLAQGLADLVRENDDGISVMQWLKSVYQRDWQNLMERLKPKLNGLDPR